MQTGNRRAEHEELLAHGSALFRFALVRVRDPHTAEDLVQDTLVTAVTKGAEFANLSSKRTWLIGILRHKILDHYRWQRRHPGDLPSAGDDDSAGGDEKWFTPQGAWRLDPNAGLEALDGDPDKTTERQELRAVLQLCIDHLPKSLHRIFVLRELQDLEPDEACEVAGISRDSLAVFLYRARQSLRACIQKKWVE
jgi:RNA polymerase sigma-70 factor, ECF subfamily